MFYRKSGIFQIPDSHEINTLSLNSILALVTAYAQMCCQIWQCLALKYND